MTGADFQRNSEKITGAVKPPGPVKTPRGSALCWLQASTQKRSAQPQGGGIAVLVPASALPGRAKPGLSKQAGEAGLGSRIRTGIVTRRAETQAQCRLAA